MAKGEQKGNRETKKRKKKRSRRLRRRRAKRAARSWLAAEHRIREEEVTKKVRPAPADAALV